MKKNNNKTWKIQKRHCLNLGVSLYIIDFYYRVFHIMKYFCNHYFEIMQKHYHLCLSIIVYSNKFYIQIVKSYMDSDLYNCSWELKGTSIAVYIWYARITRDALFVNLYPIYPRNTIFWREMVCNRQNDKKTEQNFSLKVMAWVRINLNGVSDIVILPQKTSFNADFYIENVLLMLKRHGNKLVGLDFTF